MAEFAPNLDDGELWLPSEIIADVGICRHPHRQHQHHQPSATEVELLARQFAAFGPIDGDQLIHTVSRPPTLPPHQNRFQLGGQVWTGADCNEFGLRPKQVTPIVEVCDFVAAWRRERLRFGPIDLPKTKIETFGRVQPSHLGPMQNRCSLMRNGAPGRDYGGTGVFLPRVMSSYEAKKKHHARGGQHKQPHPRHAAAMRQGMPFPPSI